MIPFRRPSTAKAGHLDSTFTVAGASPGRAGQRKGTGRIGINGTSAVPHQLRLLHTLGLVARLRVWGECGVLALRPVGADEA
jgi:hypothetical protein